MFPCKTPTPPYYAVLFANTRTDSDKGYEAMAKRMEELVSQQPGFLGLESVRNAEGQGITISYWETEEAIRAWQKNTEHRQAQALGKSTWYQDYTLRVAKVERAYGTSL